MRTEVNVIYTCSYLIYPSHDDMQSQNNCFSDILPKTALYDIVNLCITNKALESLIMWRTWGIFRLLSTDPF